MGSEESTKNYCKGNCCNQEPEYVTDKIQVQNDLNNKINNDDLMSTEIKNKEIIFQHIRASSKQHSVIEIKEEEKKKVLKIEAKKSKKLKLKVISSGGILEKGTEFIITAQGLEGGLREAKDGITYFGTNPDPLPKNVLFNYL